MSCWMFFLVLFTSSSSRDVPLECIEYVDDPGVVQFVSLPRYIEEDEIDVNGDSWYMDQV
ncbi:MAG: hypothetical protein CVU59_03855 [Deltaproteobacteria bacterium HGW-Deltaproteobacteria-17]|nr:MAG: hypothetical protein CVU59_03855 [Deltaproteobacteria bacterium HGW-Deltaproteobacteria-17]